MNIAVFCSGNGSNFQAIVNASRQGYFKSDILLMVCDKADAYAVERAKKESIKTLLVERKNFQSEDDMDYKIITQLKKYNINFICLAGYMRILTDQIVDGYDGKMINIHPSLLPSFKGASAIRDAFNYGVKRTGVTIHFVTKELDSGPIILQQAVDIQEGENIESLEHKIHKVEHRLYPLAIKLFEENKIKTTGRKVKVSYGN